MSEGTILLPFVQFTAQKFTLIVYFAIYIKIFIQAANIPGLIMSFISISLYVIYPPITWRVPILGTQQAPTKKSD